MQGVHLYGGQGKYLAVYHDPAQSENQQSKVCGYRLMEAPGRSAVKWGESRRHILEGVLDNFGQSVRFAELPHDFQEAVLDDLIILH